MAVTVEEPKATLEKAAASDDSEPGCGPETCR
jgi:hypothetical protein